MYSGSKKEEKKRVVNANDAWLSHKKLYKKQFPIQLKKKKIPKSVEKKAARVRNVNVILINCQRVTEHKKHTHT